MNSIESKKWPFNLGFEITNKSPNASWSIPAHGASKHVPMNRIL